MTTLARKGRRYNTSFYGHDDGTWDAVVGVLLSFRSRGYDWEVIPSMSSQNEWANWSVEGATEHHTGFRRALKEIAREYPEAADFVISFDGPYMPVRSLIGGADTSPEVRWAEIVFYHGTSMAAWEKIQKEGMRPRGDTNVAPVYGVGSSAAEGRKDAIYLTTQSQTAHFAARAAAKVHQSQPVVLSMQGLDGAHMAADEDSHETDPVTSLQRLGAVAYTAPIPAAHIRLYETMTENLWSREATQKDDTMTNPSDLSHRVAARYKSKKKVKTPKGKEFTVYEYSDRQVSNRDRDKAERIEKLSKSIGKLRTKVNRDLKSSDPEKMLTALAVALMDHTYERVGNETSADESGHFGVTGWLRKHLSFGRDAVTVSYVGKSGVKHKKKVTDAKIKKALRDAYEAVEDDDACLFGWEGGSVTAEKVNAYLEPFDITAKDIRGFHANRLMQENLKAVRKGKLPEDKKEYKQQLKDEFKEALELTAEAVGHEASTLRSMYLVPTMESEYIKDGTIIGSFVKTAAERVVDRYLNADESDDHDFDE